MAEIKNCINRMDRIDGIKDKPALALGFNPVDPVHPVN
jgi:hypothetical protein